MGKTRVKNGITTPSEDGPDAFFGGLGRRRPRVREKPRSARSKPLVSAATGPG